MTAHDRFFSKRSLAPTWVKFLCGLLVVSVFFSAFYIILQQNPVIARSFSQLLHHQRLIILILLLTIVAGCVAAISYIVINSRRIVTNASGYLFYPLLGLQHRFIAQKCLGRKLLWAEEVHHINGKRHDNRISNLCVMTTFDHKSFHIWLRDQRRKDGRYPPIRVQKYILTTRFNGTLLQDNQSSRLS